MTVLKTICANQGILTLVFIAVLLLTLDGLLVHWRLTRLTQQFAGIIPQSGERYYESQVSYPACLIWSLAYSPLDYHGFHGSHIDVILISEYLLLVARYQAFDFCSTDGYPAISSKKVRCLIPGRISVHHKLPDYAQHFTRFPKNVTCL